MDTKQLRALLLAATPGPWHEDRRLILDDKGDAVGMVNVARPTDSDAVFIAALRNAAPALLDCCDAAAAYLATTEVVPPTGESRNARHALLIALAALEQK